ncbi:MAG: hypothetical protein KKB20_21280 [Proteobacteria bacterium]|nr:hypothetical protein [Pseudomonadota bacterium]
MVTIYRILAVTVLLGLLASCANPQWRHPTKTPDALAKDMAECERQADLTALSASMTGRTPLLVPRYKALQACLFQKGWTIGTESQKPTADQPRELASRKEDRVLVFSGQKISLPEGARIISRTTNRIGPVLMDLVNFSLTRNGRVYYGELIFQKTLDLWFDPIVYPLAEPFFAYTGGRLESGADWRAFAGRIATGYWGGVGLYWLINPQERVIMTFSTALPVEAPPPSQRSRLTQAQADIVDELIEGFLPWMAEVTAQVPQAKGKSWKSRILEGWLD